MDVGLKPLVSVVTPVYNMGSFLSDCIESVLKQSYENFEYIIVNNCSTDESLDIALEYAKRDPRIRVHNNETFVGVIENHNTAFKLVSADAKYCKVVSADDFIFPTCVARMVEFAEANPSVGIVGAYQLSGSYIKWQGFPYPKAVFSGREICRRIFLENDRSFGFGTPTSLLYRADLIRDTEAFYPNPSPHADTSACFEQLQRSDFGFVYEVLSYERIHGATQSSTSGNMNRYSSAYLDDVKTYGPVYLTKPEFERKLRTTVKEYYEFLAANLFRSRGREFWDYHKGRLDELGYPITPTRLMMALVTRALRELKSPEQALRKVFRHP